MQLLYCLVGDLHRFGAMAAKIVSGGLEFMARLAKFFHRGANVRMALRWWRRGVRGARHGNNGDCQQRDPGEKTQMCFHSARILHRRARRQHFSVRQ